jgi:hypothetical protein
MRVLIAGLIGGIVMYIWASVAHVATPLATIGLKAMPNEAGAITALHQNLGDKPGLYFFPFMQGSASDSKAMAAQEAKLKVSPSGLLAYQPPGTPGLAPRQLVIEFVLELVESILAAFILAGAAGFSRRLGVAALIGVIAAMATNFSYWNWYGFSLDYTLANAFTELMKFVFAGAAIAWVLGWRRKAAS